MGEERDSKNGATPDPRESQTTERAPTPLLSGGKHPWLWLAIAAAIGAIATVWRCA